MLHKLRAALSILGIVCGVAAVFSMLSVGEGAKRESLAQIERLGARNIYIKSITLTNAQKNESRLSHSQGLTLYDAQRIENGCRDVQDVAGLRELKASVFDVTKDFKPLVVSVTADYASLLDIQLSDGRFICDNDLLDKKPVCVIGHSVANSMGVSGGIGNSLRIENSLFKIIGILQRFDNKENNSGAISLRNYGDMVFIPLTMSDHLSKKSSISNINPYLEVSELIISVKTSQQVLETAVLVKRILEITHGGVDDYQIVVPQELLNQSRKIQRIFNIVLGSIAFISLMVGGIGIMNIMLATVSERTREIGMRRAFGATYSDIIMQFLAESTILTFTGGVVGIFIGFPGIWIISTIAKWNTAITLFSLVLPLVMSTIAGIFFGLYPAYNASKLDPIAALRSE
ncbi:MAG: ABC transporter permease [Deltaproteobacteria bacterium]|nr:ABC transporter permease [Deltaproteobacteria bacterium]